MMRRIVVMAFGFVLAVGVAAIFLIVSALLDPATREAGFAAATSGLFAFVEEDVRAGGWSDPLATFGFILWSIIIATCVAPLAVAALIGEIAGARSLLCIRARARRSPARRRGSPARRWDLIAPAKRVRSNYESRCCFF